MFRLNVSVVNLTKGSIGTLTKETATALTLEDINISVTDAPAEDGAYDFKHIGIVVTEDVSDIPKNTSEFVYYILAADTVPADASNIFAVISPDTEPGYYSFQLRTHLMGIIDSYMFRITWQMLDTTINASPDLVWYKALNGNHFNVNDAFCYTVSREKADIEDRRHAYIWNVSEDEAFACQESEDVTLREDKTCSFEEPVNTPDGMKTMVTYKTPLRTMNGTLFATAGIAIDVTKQREYEAKLHEYAMTDSLSGLYNRRKLYEEAAVRYPDAKTVVYADIDYFKTINDTYGHEKGDKILCLVAAGLNENFSDCITARMGGDEFVILMGEEHTDEEITSKFDNIEKSLAAADDAAGIDIRLSVGIYRGNLPTEDAIKEADEMMYTDKRKHHEQETKAGR